MHLLYLVLFIDFDLLECADCFNSIEHFVRLGLHFPNNNSSEGAEA